MGNNKSRITPINDECPICYETNSNSITLPCGHKFDYICLQNTFFEPFINNKKTLCPLCRQNINIKTLKLIFKKIYIINIKPKDFVSRNTINLKFKPRISKINTYLDDSNIIYNLPCFKLDNIDIPFFFHLDNIEFIFESFTNDLNAVFKMKIECLLKPKNSWYKFIKNNHNRLDNVLKYSSNINENPKQSICLYIKNPNNIITYNERFGTINKGFIIYEQPCTILFRTYIVKTLDNMYFINELYSICYRNK